MLRFAMIGAGFWSSFQLNGWRELEGVECVGVSTRDPRNAEKLGLPREAVFSDPARMLDAVKPDFVDIVTADHVHLAHARLAIERGLPVICQKPMAADWESCVAMVREARDAGVPLYIHDNWRYQAPFRRVKQILDAGTIGEVHRARLMFVTSFPVFDNQPFLAESERFILMDVGSHVFDAARYLFGEARTVYATTQRVNPKIRGEDVATALVTMASGATVGVDLSYASPTRDERFPETYAVIEGWEGSILLEKGGRLSVTTRSGGTTVEQVESPMYAWVDPEYVVVQSSIVTANRAFLGAMQGDPSSALTGEDNLRSMALVFASYRSAETGQVVDLADWSA